MSFNVTDGNSFMNINHSGNEAWSFKCESGAGSADFLTIGASGGTAPVKFGEDGEGIFTKIGVGIDIPTKTLDIRTDTGVLIKGASGTTSAKISFLPASGGRQYDLGNVGADFRIFDASANVTRMYFDNDGNTGIRTITPDTLLQVTNTADGTDYISYEIGNSAVNANNKGGFAIHELGVKQATLEYYRDGSGKFEIASQGASNHISLSTTAVGDTVPTERIKVTSTGVVEISNGIKLGGTAAANLLDDYEEGAWTPVLGGTWTTDPTNLTGHYTKIGRQVTITMQFTGGAKSSSISGYFTGIPFNIIKNGTGSVSDSGVQNLGNCLFANTNRVWFTATNLGSGTVYVSGTYFAA